MSETKWVKIVEDWLLNNNNHMIDLLKEMVQYKSVNPKFIECSDDSESDSLQASLEDYLLNLGLDVEKWDVTKNQPNIVATMKGKSNKNALILNGHIDVVPAGDLSMWTVDPWKGEVVENKLYGRGSCDMKAGVLSNIMVAKFLADFGIELETDLQLHIVVDEEGGGSGTRSILTKGFTGGGVIVTESTNCIINPVSGGLQWARVKLTGRSEHSAWRYTQLYPGYKRTASNAIESGYKVLQAINELEKAWGLTESHPLLPAGMNTINPGVMLAGAGNINKDGIPKITTNPAIIPDVCVIDFDIKYLPNENLEDIQREFEECINHVASKDSWLKEHLPEIEWGFRGISFPPVNTEIDHQIVSTVANSQELLGISPTYEGFIMVSDAAFYSGSGIPSIIYGPRGSNLHGPDEYVELSSVFEVTKVLIMSALKWNKII